MRDIRHPLRTSRSDQYEVNRMNVATLVPHPYAYARRGAGVKARRMLFSLGDLAPSVAHICEVAHMRYGDA